MIGYTLASYPVPSGGERAWYTLQAHAPGDPRKNWGNRILSYTLVYSPFIVHRTARHAKPASNHHGNATGHYGDASARARNVYQALLLLLKGLGTRLGILIQGFI